ncbi:hypothetical protein MtrunA17_Chr3g0133421 [Medicago truncatula]|uniref:Uncharacterized protein n=1 Tax=Medicago truncatula TaxID=3880 RepID=G7J5R1_MEDTR|nr:hypothetical protein MTR_3g101040 [Medicago truncatula]RHN70240.1 hypothetical protein MtrunA17_Chr3g0133421 [Medicago truncatula]
MVSLTGSNCVSLRSATFAAVGNCKITQIRHYSPLLNHLRPVSSLHCRSNTTTTTSIAFFEFGSQKLKLFSQIGIQKNRMRELIFFLEFEFHICVVVVANLILEGGGNSVLILSNLSCVDFCQ